MPVGEGAVGAAGCAATCVAAVADAGVQVATVGASPNGMGAATAKGTGATIVKSSGSAEPAPSTTAYVPVASVASLIAAFNVERNASAVGNRSSTTRAIARSTIA